MTLSTLDERTRVLLRLAAAVSLGDGAGLADACQACRSAGVPQLWVEELLLQSLLVVGWPRTLNGFAEWAKGREGNQGDQGDQGNQGEDGTDYSQVGIWRTRGEEVCREVYGDNYLRLRKAVRQLHPALEAWMIIEGYGKTLGRPGLDLARRELCTVVQVALMGAGAERQLHSHLRGSLNAGASPAVITEALEEAREVGRRANGGGAGSELEHASALWDRIRP